MSWGQLLLSELKAIFSHKALLLTVFGGVVFYSFLYPLPYRHQLPRDQKIVVVNFDKSSLSRKLIRMVDATPQINVTHYAGNIPEAEKWIEENGLAGMLVVPKHFYRDILLGKSPVMAYSGDASYFLVYSTVVKGMVTAGETLAARIKINRMLNEQDCKKCILAALFSFEAYFCKKSYFFINIFSNHALLFRYLF